MIIKCNRCNKDIYNPNAINAKYILVSTINTVTISETIIHPATQANIVGDKDSFLGQEGDKITIIIDGIEYANIDINICTSINDVLNCINTAINPNLAILTEDNFIQIISRFFGSNSNCSIDNGSESTQSVIEKLFSTENIRINQGLDTYVETVPKEIQVTDCNALIICPECLTQEDTVIW